MKFYEFNDFGYYALIGAETEERAIEYYNETVAEIGEEDNDTLPVEISREEARTKLLNASEKEEDIRIKEFDLCTSTIEPYLILIDGSLL